MTKSQSPLFSILLDQSDRAGALSRQLYNQIKRFIQSGHLKEGDKLPSSRDLCKKLGIGRITVISAYKALCDEGFVESIEDPARLLVTNCQLPVRATMLLTVNL